MTFYLKPFISRLATWLDYQRISEVQQPKVKAAEVIHQIKPFKPFFIHYQRRSKKNSCGFNGFTAYISPDESGQVRVQYSLCSRKDVFSKKLGRSYALQREGDLMNPRHVGRYLTNLHYKCHNISSDHYLAADVYLHVYKYML